MNTVVMLFHFSTATFTVRFTLTTDWNIFTLHALLTKYSVFSCVYVNTVCRNLNKYAPLTTECDVSQIQTKPLLTDCLRVAPFIPRERPNVKHSITGLLL